MFMERTAETKKTSWCVAVCVDQDMLPGFQATIRSLVFHCSSPSRIRIKVFSDDLLEADIKSLRSDLVAAGICIDLKLIKADPSSFSTFKSLHGNRLTYYRILLPQILGFEDYVVYLDSDLWVGLDILTILDHLPSAHPFAAGAIGTVEYSLEGNFFRSLGMNNNDATFNAGVIVFNCKRCAEVGFVKRCLDFANQYPDALLSADQTILNALFCRDFYPLPEPFNRLITPHQRLSETLDPAIYHFVGSPKPWDLLGSWIHRSARLWKATVKHTSYHHNRWLILNLGGMLRRTWSIRRSYLRELRRRMRSDSN